MPWCNCGHYITLTQAQLSSMRNDKHEPACKDCVTKELTEAQACKHRYAPGETPCLLGCGHSRPYDIGVSNEANNEYWRKVHFPELEQKRCDHKFVDSGHCLKCGWRP